MKIVTYHERHFEGVDRLWKSCFPGNSARNQAGQSIPAKLVLGDDLLIVAEDEEAGVVGTVMAGYDGHRGWLYSLAVRPEKRNAGIGAKLVEEACRRLSERGCVKVNLQVVEGNEGVVAFYSKLGFSTEARI